MDKFKLGEKLLSPSHSYESYVRFVTNKKGKRNGKKGKGKN